MSVQTSKVLHQFGTWVVTTYGLENTAHYYPIAKDRVFESDWIAHIGMKHWPSAWKNGFPEALQKAREVYALRQQGIHTRPQENAPSEDGRRMTLMELLTLARERTFSRAELSFFLSEIEESYGEGTVQDLAPPQTPTSPGSKEDNPFQRGFLRADQLPKAQEDGDK